MTPRDSCAAIAVDYGYKSADLRSCGARRIQRAAGRGVLVGGARLQLAQGRIRRLGERADATSGGQRSADRPAAQRPAPDEHPRIHFDLHVANLAEQESEARRLVGLGAKRVEWDSYPDDPDFIVLEDPEGNRFCIVDLSHQDQSVAG